jgi:hypothetical protein
VDGEKAVAHTTLTSEYYYLNNPTNGMFFGRRMPNCVLTAQLFRDCLNDQFMVRWRVKGDPDIHEMPFEQTDEGVIAALAAMKLTC